MAKKGQKFKRYSIEFKQEAVRLYLEENFSYRAVARKMGISDTRVIRDWVKKFNNNKTLENQTGKTKSPLRGRQKVHFSSVEEERDYLKAQVEYLKKQYPNLHGEGSFRK